MVAVKQSPILPAKKSDDGNVTEAIALIKTYVQQETLGPLKGIGRKIALGAAGSLAMGLGLFFLSLGILRLIQAKVERLASGSLSWISYVIVFLFSAAVAGLALWRVSKIEKELH